MPVTNRTPPTAIAIILCFLSAAVNSDQGFCFLPIEIPITMPAAIPAPRPTAKPIEHSV